jgi:2,3-bisphosphoglycerate-independent phosphoglycerate mutase
MIPSPRDVATYDKKPEMNEAAVADAVVLDAAIRAVEAVDAGVGRIVSAAQARGGALFITADHGNCELMKDPSTGAQHTSHTTNPVPLIYVRETDRVAKLLPGGRICDVAPTMLEVLRIPRPSVMTGYSLLSYPKSAESRLTVELGPKASTR